MKPRRQLALALDVDTPAALSEWCLRLRGKPVVLKLGLRLLPKLSEDDFKRMKADGFRLFIDAKLHDIPSQVAGAVATWSARGADYLTVHLSGGPRMLREAQAAAGATELLGVSVLTSLGSEDLRLMGFMPNPAQQVTQLVRMATTVGMRSFVCSVGESQLIKTHAQNELGGALVRTVCPGIQIRGGAQSDQSRSYTVAEAIAADVDMLVIGRAILKDAHPQARIDEVMELLA
ncbi:MAG: orotidine-5'-phosphate decarboxylase [Bdellovibrionales bacterium]|nr:orotidine-5'-phosphate decarboxylase [Bdellovibrionales bacterium]